MLFVVSPDGCVRVSAAGFSHLSRRNHASLHKSSPREIPQRVLEGHHHLSWRLFQSDIYLSDRLMTDDKTPGTSPGGLLFWQKDTNTSVTPRKQQGLQRPFESNRISRASKVRPSPPLSDWRPAARGKRRHSRRIFSGIGDSVWLSSASDEGIWKGTRCQATWWLPCRLLGANAAGQVSIPQMRWFSIREAVGICSASWKGIVPGLFSLIPSITRADANANNKFLAVLTPPCPDAQPWR